MVKFTHSSRLIRVCLLCLCLESSLNACQFSSNPRNAATSTPDPVNFFFGEVGAPVPTEMYGSWQNICTTIGAAVIGSLPYTSTNVLPEVDPPQILEPAEGGILPFGTVTLSYLVPASPQPTLYDLQSGFFVIDINTGTIVGDFPPAVVSTQAEAIVDEQWMPMYPGGYMLVVLTRAFPVVTSPWYQLLVLSNIGGPFNAAEVCIIVENTVTITPSPSLTTTPTSSQTATLTPTPSPTETSTFKPPLPTRVLPTPIPPPVVSCSDFTDYPSCREHGCEWGPLPPTGALGCK